MSTASTRSRRDAPTAATEAGQLPGADFSRTCWPDSVELPRPFDGCAGDPFGSVSVDVTYRNVDERAANMLASAFKGIWLGQLLLAEEEHLFR